MAVKTHRTLVFLVFFCLGPTAGQERPRYTTPQFTPIAHRTDVCDRHMAYVNGSLELRNALHGLNLTVGIVDQLNDIFIRFDDDGGLSVDDPGLFPILLDELASRGGFEWRSSFARVLPPYSEELEGQGRSWTDILLDAIDRYDFTFAEWVHSTERRRLGVSFPEGWYDASTILVQQTKVAQAEFAMSSFLHPFSNSVWMMIFAVFVFSGVVYTILESINTERRAENPNEAEKRRQKKGYNIFMSAMTFTQHHMEWYPISHAERLFAFSVSFWSLIIASAYTANMASFLVAQSRPHYVALSLQEAETNNVQVCVRSGAAVANAITTKYPTLNLVEAPDFAETYENLRMGRCKLLATRASDFAKFRRDELINPDCTLEWIGRADEINAGGAATIVDTGVLCTSLVSHVLDIHFNEMIQDGFVSIEWEKHLRSLSTNMCEQAGSKDSDTGGEEGSQSLTPVDVGGIFALHGILAIVALVMALIERQIRHRKRRDGHGQKSSTHHDKERHSETTASESLPIEECMYDSAAAAAAAAEDEEYRLMVDAISALNRHLSRRRGGKTQKGRSASSSSSSSMRGGKCHDRTTNLVSHGGLYQINTTDEGEVNA